MEQGDGCNRDLRRFTDSPTFARFDETAEFRTQRDAGGITYTRFSLTLQSVVDGNVQVSPVDEGSYPG